MSTAQPPPATDLAIDLRNLTRRFGERVAVAGVTYQVRRGDLFALLGANGCGKSTTIRMMCGLLTPSGGSGTVLGYDIATQGEAIKPHIGYMSQKFGLYRDLTVQENMEFYAGLYEAPLQGLKERIASLIAMAGLTGREKQLAGNLSGGWAQRLALGCALIHDPPLIFLDEPTAGVDPVGRRDFWRTIRGLARRGVTILVTTHYLDEAEFANRVALMADGKMVALDTPAALKRSLRGTLLEVECDRPREAQEALGRVPGVKATLYGVLLHVTLDEGIGSDTVTRALADAGFTVRETRSLAPTLEDVFVSLIGKST